MKRKKGFDKSIILLIVIVCIIGGVSFYIYNQFRTDRITEALEAQETFNTAFFISQGEELLFSEVFFYNPKTQKGALLDVPSELGSLIQSESKIEKIAILYKPGEIGAVKKKIEDLTGVEIPFYFEIDIEEVEKLVDLLGGLEMFIANPVERVEESSMVLLPSGSLVLDGAKIKSYLLFEGEEKEPEIETIGRKQKFVQAFLTKLGMKYQELQHENVFPYFENNVHTNLDKQSLLSFIGEMRKLDGERIVFQRVLGVHRVVDGKKLLFPHYDGKLLKETVNQTIDSLESEKPASDTQLTISLEVLNGTPRNGLASRTSNIFKSFGYDVVNIGNAEHFSYEETIVIDRTGDVNKAQKVANIINCKNIETDLYEEPSQTPDEDQDFEHVDVTVILGKDFDGRYCKN